MSKTSIFDRMRNDHREVLEKIAVLDSAAGKAHGRHHGRGWPAGTVTEVLDMLERQFSTHMAAEDEILFPALLEALPQARLSIEPLQADHVELRTMLNRLRETLWEPAGDARNEQIGVQLRDFVDLLRIHIRKEEAVVISVAERVLKPCEVQALAARMAHPERGESNRRPGSGPSKGARS